MIGVEKRRQLNEEAKATPPMQFRIEQILTKTDGDRFRTGVVKNEIIDTKFVRVSRGRIEERACPNQMDACQAAKIPDRGRAATSSMDHVDRCVPRRQVTLRREIAFVCKLPSLSF